ncbi:MAG: integrin alpha [Myxococcota bacterium]
MTDATATFAAQNTLDFFGAGVDFDDADGDGRDDLLIGAPEGTTYSEGRAYLLLGPVSSQLHVERTADAFFTGPPYGLAGITVRIEDLDGDGAHDLGVRCRNEGDDTQRPQVAILDPTGPRERTMDDAKAVLEGEEYADGAGTGLEALGDVDGDGVGDLAVSAPLWGPSFDGRVYIVRGPIGGSVQLADADAIVTSAVPGAYLGTALAAGHDLDGDGVVDVVAGGHLDSADLPRAGRAVVFPGNVLGEHTADAFPIQLQGDHPFSQLGANLASPGDIDGDGEPDLVVSAPDSF